MFKVAKSTQIITTYGHIKLFFKLNLNTNTAAYTVQLYQADRQIELNVGICINRICH